MELVLGVIGVLIAAGGLWWQIAIHRGRTTTRVTASWVQADCLNRRYRFKLRIRNTGHQTAYVEKLRIGFLANGGDVERLPKVREIPPHGSTLESFNIDFSRVTGAPPSAVCAVTLADGTVVQTGESPRFDYDRPGAREYATDPLSGGYRGVL